MFRTRIIVHVIMDTNNKKGFAMDLKEHAREQALKAMNFRYAAREYDGTKKVDSNDLHTVLEAGRLSPSSFGFEPWKFLVLDVTDGASDKAKQLKEQLAPYLWGAKGVLANGSYLIIILGRKNVRYDSAYIEHMMRDIQQLPAEIAESHRSALENFQKNDCHTADNPEALFDWSARQCYIALANMMTTAAFLRLSTLPVEGFDQENVARVLADGGYLGTDGTEFGVAVMMGIGYGKPAKHTKTRQPMCDIVQMV